MTTFFELSKPFGKVLARCRQGDGKVLAYSNSLLDYANSMPRAREERRKSEVIPFQGRNVNPPEMCLPAG